MTYILRDKGKGRGCTPENPMVLAEDANGVLFEESAPNSNRKVCATPHCYQPCYHIGLCNPLPADQDKEGGSSRRTSNRKNRSMQPESETEAAHMALAIAASLKA